MKKNKKYIDDGIELIIKAIEDNVSSVEANFEPNSVDIQKAIKLFEKDQILNCMGDDASYHYALLTDGRLLHFAYYGIALSQIKVSLVANASNCTIKTTRFEEPPYEKCVHIYNEDGVDITGPLYATEYMLEDLDCKFSDIKRSVSVEQLQNRGLRGLNRDDYANNITYTLAKMADSDPDYTELEISNESMEDIDLYKIFDEDQMILSECNDVTTCWAVLEGKALYYACIPSTNANAYYMALYPDASEFIVEPRMHENGRISIQITNPCGQSFYVDNPPAYLETPAQIDKKQRLTDLVRPIKPEELRERAKKSNEK